MLDYLFLWLLSFWIYYLKNIEKGKKTAATYTAQSTVRRINAQLNQYVELSEFLGNVVLAGYNLDQTSFGISENASKRGWYCESF